MKAAAAERERRLREEAAASKAAQGSKHLIKQLQHKRFRQVPGPGAWGLLSCHLSPCARCRHHFDAPTESKRVLHAAAAVATPVWQYVHVAMAFAAGKTSCRLC